MKDTFNTVRSVANCCLGAGFLEGRVRVSVKGFHFKPKIFTIFFVLVVSSYVACSRGEGLFEDPAVTKVELCINHD